MADSIPRKVKLKSGARDLDSTRLKRIDGWSCSVAQSQGPASKMEYDGSSKTQSSDGFYIE